MSARLSRLSVTLCLLAGVAGCAKSSPTQPGGAGPSIVAPAPVTPANNASVLNSAQPVTLTVQNAVTTSGTPTYTFEVASDSNFTTIVQTKDGVAQGSGQTSVALSTLDPAKDYYWRARASAGGTTGVYGTVYKFTVGPVFTLTSPGLVAPANGAATAAWPKFKVTNASHSGAVGSVTYRFDISTNDTFTAIILTSTVPEGGGQTTFTPTTHSAPPGQVLFWRVTALDSNGLAGVTSAVQSFTPVNTDQSNLATLLGLSLWPDAQPPGTNGHATLGQNWGIQTLLYEPTHVEFLSPTQEALQLFDLLDRGMNPDQAAFWMNTNGYPTTALFYPPPEKAVIGIQYIYIGCVDNNSDGPCNSALTNGHWDIILRVE
jgi:hypothetical protein